MDEEMEEKGQHVSAPAPAAAAAAAAAAVSLAAENAQADARGMLNALGNPTVSRVFFRVAARSADNAATTDRRAAAELRSNPEMLAALFAAQTDHPAISEAECTAYG